MFSFWIRIIGKLLPFVNKIGVHWTLHFIIFLINIEFINSLHPNHFKCMIKIPTEGDLNNINLTMVCTRERGFWDPNLVGEEKQQRLYLTGFGFYLHKSLVINILSTGLGKTDENSISSAGICSRYGTPKGVPNFHWSFFAPNKVFSQVLTGIRLL